MRATRSRLNAAARQRHMLDLAARLRVVAALVRLQVTAALRTWEGRLSRAGPSSVSAQGRIGELGAEPTHGNR